MYFFDVSLGDAVYVRTPSGEDVIIDGGDSRNELSAFLDFGEKAASTVRGAGRGQGGFAQG